MEESNNYDLSVVPTTTLQPTTMAPTTIVPTTISPTTQEPTTASPTSNPTSSHHHNEHHHHSRIQELEIDSGVVLGFIACVLCCRCIIVPKEKEITKLHVEAGMFFSLLALLAVVPFIKND